MILKFMYNFTTYVWNHKLWIVKKSLDQELEDLIPSLNTAASECGHAKNSLSPSLLIYKTTAQPTPPSYCEDGCNTIAL